MPSRVQYTTGTTGRFLPLVRSQAELDFIAGFFNDRVATSHADDEIRPLWLSLTSAYHGSPTPVPGWPFMLSAGCYDRPQTDSATRLLLAEHAFPSVESRVTAIVGGDLVFKTLTAHLVSQGIAPHTTKVRHVILTGGYMTPTCKLQLSELWNAAIHDRYSMSEMFGGAAETSIGGPWVFDAYVLPEVVHPRTLQPIEAGVGVLLLTGLYPFMQAMPLVRYYTGDLVEIVPAGKQKRVDLMVRFVGRERRSVLDLGQEDVVPLILSGPLYEILDTVSDISVTPRLVDVGAGSDLELGGNLHYAVDWEPSGDNRTPEIRLTLGLRYPPWIHTKRVVEICSQIRTRLYERFDALRERVLDGALDFRIDCKTAAEVPMYNTK